MRTFRKIRKRLVIDETTKRQVTPSLILEKYELTDAHRLKEAEKWISKIQEMFDINRSKYISKGANRLHQEIMCHS